MKYDSIDDVLAALGIRGGQAAGWQVSNKTPVEEEVPNPAFNPKRPVDASDNPRTIKRVSPTKTTWIIVNPRIPGQQPVHAVIDEQAPAPAGAEGPDPATGGTGPTYTIQSGLTGTLVTQPAAGAGQNSSELLYIPNGLDPTGKTEVAVRLQNGKYVVEVNPTTQQPITRPTQAQSTGRTAPTWVTNPANPSQEIYAQVGADGKLIPVSFNGTDMVRPQQNGQQPRAPSAPDWVDEPGNPGFQVYGQTNADGTFTPATLNGQIIRQPKPPAAGSTSTPDWFDDPTMPGMQVLRRLENGVLTDVLGNDGQRVVKKKDAPVSVTGTDSNSPNTNVIDNTGKVIATYPNNNYQQPNKTVLTPDTKSEFIVTMDPKTGALTWTRNQNQQTVDENMAQLAESLGLKVKAGSMTMDQAQSLIQTAVQALTARTQSQQADTQAQESARAAAGNALDYTKTNAQTGASVINTRVQAASDMVNKLAGLPGQLAQSAGGRYGSLPGGLTGANLPANLGQNLVQGSLGFSAEAAGGQGVLDAAARMVQEADPKSDMYSPLAQAATGVIAQILNKWPQVNGGAQHPLVQAQQAMIQGNQNGTFVAPPTAMGMGGSMQAAANPNAAGAAAAGADPSRAAYRSPAWNLVTGAQDPGSLLAPGRAGAVDPSDPRYMGTVNGVRPNINISIGGVS